MPKGRGGSPGGPETRLALSRTLLSSLALLLEALYFLCVHVHVCIYVHVRAVACGGQRSILSFSPDAVYLVSFK